MLENSKESSQHLKVATKSKALYILNIQNCNCLVKEWNVRWNNLNNL